MYSLVLCFFFYRYCYHLDLHVLTHSFPTRRSSDLALCLGECFGQVALHLSQPGTLQVGHAFEDERLIQLLGKPMPERSLAGPRRSEEHTSELQSLMRISYAVFCLKKKTQTTNKKDIRHPQNDHELRNSTTYE